MIMLSNRCYAQSLGNCSPDISHEHPISRSILDEINEIEIICSGFPWLKGKTVNIPPLRLASKVLCRNHNKELSVIDSYTWDFFKNLKKIYTEPHIEKTVYCDTNKIQRWLVKMYLGLHTGKHLGKDGKPLSLSPNDIESHLLDNLFHGLALPNPLGIYIAPNLQAIPGAKRNIVISNRITITSYLLEGTEIICALLCDIMGIIPFFLQIREPLKSETILIDRPSVYHIYNSELKFNW